MMRILIPFVAALGLSLGVSTGIVMMRAPHAASVAADSTKADSAKTDSAHATAKKDSVPMVAAAHTDSTHADSVKIESASTDSVARNVASAGTPKSVPALASKDKAQNPPATPATGAKGGIPHAAALQDVARRVTNIARSDSTEKKLAKVFASMQARDAAHILQQMDDSDVQVIMTSLSPKQQAAILGQFPAQRAAALARNALRDGDDQ